MTEEKDNLERLKELGLLGAIDEPYSCECMCCFLCFESETEEFMCSVCKEHPEWIKKNNPHRIDRVVQVMDRAHLTSFPKAVRLIWDYLRNS